MDFFDACPDGLGGDRWLYEVQDDIPVEITDRHIESRLSQIHQKVENDVREALEWWDIFDSMASSPVSEDPVIEVAEFSLTVKRRLKHDGGSTARMKPYR